jgi:hypothetical protein
MTGEDGDTAVATEGALGEEAPEPFAGLRGTFASLKLPSALHAIAWSTGAAAIAWLAACLGQAYMNGRFSALGLDGLSLPPISQSNTLNGISILLQSAVDVVLAMIVGRACYLILRWLAQKANRRLRWSVPSFVGRRWWWLVLALVLVDGAFFFGAMAALEKQGDGIILRTTSDVGEIWTQVIFDTDGQTVAGLDVAYGAGLAIFVGLSWWLIRKGFKRPWSRIAFSLYALTGALSFLFGCAYLSGIASTVHDFPVVAYSGISPSDHGYICFLLGEDDKTFALLALHLDDKKQVDTKYVLYVPRTEVKWMTVIGYMPIYRMADINDLVRLTEQLGHVPQ